MNFFERYHLRRRTKELLQHARHVRHLREDVTAPEVLARFDAAVQRVRDDLRAQDWVGVVPAAEELSRRIDEEVYPRRSCPGLRGNLEVLVMAIAIAMAIKTYFIQPFKIPTGSMQPTLYGITVDAEATPGVMDKPGLNIVQRFFLGQRYMEVRAPKSGLIRRVSNYAVDPLAYERFAPMRLLHWLMGTYPPSPSDVYMIGGVLRDGQWYDAEFVFVHRDMKLDFMPDTTVVKGQRLATGMARSGDFIFVDKISWNFRRPRRGEVMVFRTDNIPDIGRQKTHYIKRMVGMPGETIRIVPPNVLVDGSRIDMPATITRIEDMARGYHGYQVTGNSGDPLGTSEKRLHLGAGEYLALGDNTPNSKDGRYWGSVPAGNLVGPAVWVYFPFSSRWGVIR